MRKVLLAALVAVLVAAFLAWQNTLAWVGQQGPIIPYIPMAATCAQTAALTTPVDVGSSAATGLGNLIHTAATEPPPSTADVKGAVDGVLGVVESWWADFTNAARGHQAPSKGPRLLHQYPPGDPRGNPNLAAYASCCPSTGSTAQPAAQTVAYATGSPRATGQRMAAAMGWTGFQWTALDQLWTHESNWDPHAANPGSGAYGIPQSLPASKMATAGADWHDNPATQIRWGLDYIKAAYGDPATAWAKWQARFPHWYSAGGVVTGPWKGPMADNVLAHVTPGEVVVPNGTPAQQMAFLAQTVGCQGSTAQTAALPTTGSGGPAPASFDTLGNPRTVAQALAWDAQAVATGFTEAQSHWCDHYAAYAYGWPSSGSTTALVHWAAIPANLRHPGMSAPPAGALVFWRTSAAGHVAISRGDGTVYTTDQGGLHIGVKPLSWYDSAGRVGWAAPDFPGHRP